MEILLSSGENICLPLLMENCNVCDLSITYTVQTELFIAQPQSGSFHNFPISVNDSFIFLIAQAPNFGGFGPLANSVVFVFIFSELDHCSAFEMTLLDFMDNCNGFLVEVPAPAPNLL